MNEKPFKVLVTGARGQLGYELVQMAPDWALVLGKSSSELDITEANAVENVVQAFKPDLIINAAAYTAVDKAESEIERAYAVNRDGVRNLAQSAVSAGVPVFHVSTDYVFSGDADRPYSEIDPTGPTGVYGASKLAGEETLLALCVNSLVLRISWVFGSHGNNFVKTMLRLGRSQPELGVVADQYGCPTSARGVANTLWILSNRYRQQGQLQWGIYHYSGTPACTWHDFAVEIFRQAYALDLLQQAPIVNKISTAEYPTPAKRPAWSVLTSDKLQSVYGIEPTDWREELAILLPMIRIK